MQKNADEDKKKEIGPRRDADGHEFKNARIENNGLCGSGTMLMAMTVEGG